ncbi:hypothetical protein A1O3_07462 [Capronia epimyces CBS 606.96]|uniref:Transcription factor domain-containing protein n=1 Tax=Capronia epimyces CBS 606.96 TaxID=1182542 RepID=W9XKW3_9EURO|nr:uncharacterized protein A1O3_07462 [Capronia epimyces CBS 606.96]EXJ81172.1 hypothetical protein A1O3_07462 [Capronia epimyces CBS 606.96]
MEDTETGTDEASSSSPATPFLVSQSPVRIDQPMVEVDSASESSFSHGLPSSGHRGYELDISLALVPSPSIAPVLTDLDSRNVPLFDFMRRVFVPHLVRPVTDRRYVDGFISQSLQLACEVPFFMNALMACSGAEFPTDNDRHRKVGESYYTKALAGLRAHLARDYSQQTETVALRAIFLLCIYERSRLYLSKDVHTHLVGAAVLIKSCCDHMHQGVPEDLPDRLGWNRVVSLEAFIFHTATSIPFQSPACRSTIVDDAFDTALHTLGQLVRNGAIDPYKLPILGAPPKLFAYVRQVALLYQDSRSKNTLERQQCLKLEQELKNWNIGYPVDDFPSCSADSTPRRAEESIANEALCLSSYYCPSDAAPLLGPQLYILAARILLRHMMKQNDSIEQSFSELISEAMTLAINIEPSVDYYADYYAWPFFCLGVTLRSSLHRTLLMDKIVDFWESTTNGTMRRLADMLRDEWSSSER